MDHCECQLAWTSVYRQQADVRRQLGLRERVKRDTRLDDHRIDRPSKGTRHFGAATETHDKVRTPRAET
jgi:hypothetical protein